MVIETNKNMACVALVLAFTLLLGLSGCRKTGWQISDDATSTSETTWSIDETATVKDDFGDDLWAPATDSGGTDGSYGLKSSGTTSNTFASGASSSLQSMAENASTTTTATVEEWTPNY